MGFFDSVGQQKIAQWGPIAAASPGDGAKCDHGGERLGETNGGGEDAGDEVPCGRPRFFVLDIVSEHTAAEF